MFTLFHKKVIFIAVHTKVLGLSRADWGIFRNCNFFITNNFYRLYVTTTSYKLTLSTRGMLQVSCRHTAGKAEIQPLVWNQTNAITKCQENFSNHKHFFFVWARSKLKLFWKDHEKKFNIGSVHVELFGFFHKKKLFFFVISQLCSEILGRMVNLFNIYTSHNQFHCIVFSEQFSFKCSSYQRMCCWF